MATPFHLELVTPERVLFSGETDEVSLRADGGEIAFLAGHEDYIGAVDVTAVHVHTPSSSGTSHDQARAELVVAVHGGFVEVNRDGVVILAGVAELASEIDVERAQRAFEAANARVAEGQAPSDTETDERADPTSLAGARVAFLAPNSAVVALRRARVRLEVAGAAARS